MKNSNFCIHDNILDGIDFDELIVTLNCNEAVVNEATVKQVFNEILQLKIEDARDLLKRNMKQIIEKCK